MKNYYKWRYWSFKRWLGLKVRGIVSFFHPYSGEEIKIMIIKNTWLGDSIIPHGYGNGYIGLPHNHPWFGKPYDDIPCEVHGGLTYSDYQFPDGKIDGYWWIGFDTVHSGDNQWNCNEQYVTNEVLNMVKQAKIAT